MISWSFTPRLALFVLLATNAADAHSMGGEVVLVNGDRLSGSVTALSERGLEVQSKETGTKTIAKQEWLRWNHPVEPAARPRVHFGRRSRLVAKPDWTGKVPIVVSDDTVTISTTALGEVQLRRADIRCLLIEAAKDSAAARRPIREADEPSAEDRVWLVDGDVLRGRVINFDGTTLQLDLAGRSVPILVGRVAGFAFASGDTNRAKSAAAFLVGFDDGTLIEAANTQLEGGKLSLTSISGERWSAPRAKGPVYLQSMARNVIYLSDLDPVDFVHTPYFGGRWPLGRDRGYAGSMLQAGGNRYAKGLAMHSAARAVYRLPEGASRLVADIALDDLAGQGGSVVFRVYRLTKSGLELAFESEVIRSGHLPQTIDIDVAGTSAVVLVVDYADRGDELDHADWLDARFVL